MSNINTLITSTEIKILVRDLPTKKSPGPDRFIAEFYQILNEELISRLVTLFHKIQREAVVQNSFYNTSITLIPKPSKDASIKESFMLISMMNRGANILKKILPNKIQQHIKKIIHHGQVGFTPGIQEWFNIYKIIYVIQLINKNQGEKPHYHLSRCRKNLWQNSTFFSDKSSKETRNSRNILQDNKAICDKLITNII
jgi:hypothetical protein